MKKSDFLSLNWLDLGKGVILAVIVFLLNYAQETFIPSLNISPEIKLLLITGVGYLIKNFFTKSESNDSQFIGGGGIQNPPPKQQ